MQSHTPDGYLKEHINPMQNACNEVALVLLELTLNIILQVNDARHDATTVTPTEPAFRRPYARLKH